VLLARQQPPAIDPEEFAQGVGVSTVGLLLGSLFRLDHDGLAATVFGQQSHQPDHVTLFIPKIHGQLLAVLVNGQV